MIGAYAVKGLVVSPFNSGLRMRTFGIAGSKLYGRTMDDKSNLVVDLRQGCVWEAERSEFPLCYGLNDVAYDKRMAKEALDLQYSEDRAKRWRQLSDDPKSRELLPGWYEELYGLAAALAAGRVSASELEKGLKARGLVMPGKAINNYLGGWSFYLEDDLEREVIATAFMYHCFKQWGK